MAYPTHRRWLDRTQPQTLYMASILLYINAAFEVIGLLAYGLGPFALVEVVLLFGQAAAAWGIANEKRLGYYLGIAMAFLQVVLVFKYHGGFINLLFTVALVALLLHKQSRAYQKIWFK